MDAAQVVALSLAIATASWAHPVGEPDAAFVTRIISASPMSPNERVNARLTGCSLVVDRTIPSEKKRLVVPLGRLDERSFDVTQDAEWGWFVEVQTLRHRREIESRTAKRNDHLAELYIHVFDQKNAERVRDALVRLVRACRRADERT